MFPKHLRSTTHDGVRKSLSHRVDPLQNLDEATSSEPIITNNNNNNHAQVRRDFTENRGYNETDVCTRRAMSGIGSPVELRHHQRTASGGIDFMHAAIAAATASLTDENWPSLEDEDDEDGDEEDNVFQGCHSSKSQPENSGFCNSQFCTKLSMLPPIHTANSCVPRPRKG